MAVGAALATLAAAGISAWVQYNAQKKARRAHKEAQETEMSIFRRTFGEERRATRVGEKLAKERLAVSKQELQAQKSNQFVTNFLTMLNTRPQARQQMLAISRGR